ncbi:TetR family transcriptional regulator [Parasphingorhabdus sp.]|jgi:AcrR family transcriptional regulator|uniref:TetR family transcriptional regulator n=1 Tax=Parasphingorhabdus sp. TaxID=2709688 RepID=UPI0007F39ECB|nr:TetR family transcriptional regulator [Sphingomonadales bacterium EhC05]
MSVEKLVPKENEAGARDKLIENASLIMREGDTIDISFSELSVRSGLNSALVKYYFGNKDGLLEAILERDMDNILEQVGLLIRKDMPPEDKLRHHIGAVIDTYYEFPYLNRLTMRLIRDLPPEGARNIADKYLKPLSEAYNIFVGEGIKSGVFRDMDADLFYSAVTGAADRFFTGKLVWKYCYGRDDFDEKIRDRYREQTVDLIMAGILKR